MLRGSAIDVIEEQPSKTPSPVLVRLAGSSIDVNEEQPHCKKSQYVTGE